jgi:hypothetical protein
MHLRSFSFAAALTVFTLSGTALAQQPAAVNMIGYGGLPGRAPQGAPTGLQMGDSAILHAGIGAEAGYDTNVFYDNEGGAQGAGILRILPFLELTNTTRTGEVPSGHYYDLAASLLYREYLSNKVDEENRRAFMPSIAGSLELSGNQAVSLTLSDTFTRTEDPPYFAGAPITRNANLAMAQVRLTPGGGRLQGLVRYTNGIDIFDKSSSANSNYTYANAMSHEAMLDFSWKWLPKTAVFIQGRQGYVQYFNDGSGSGISKVSSYPLHVTIGLRGLITEKLSVGLAVGYANAFYSSGQSTGGLWGSTYVSADVAYRPMLSTLVTLGYRHDFQNSIISNFYYVDGVYASLQQQLLTRISLSLSGRWEHRNFQGLQGAVTSRTDDFFQVGATADVTIRGGLYAGIGYSLLANSSDQVSLVGSASPEYLKHQVFGRLGFTY